MGGRVLVAAESATHRILIRVKLAAGRYVIDTAKSGQEVLAHARAETPPDIVIVDNGMSDLNGSEICRQLKADVRTRSLPVIVVTGSEHDAAATLSALKSGADEVLVPPLDDLSLIARIRSLMRARKTTEALGQRERTVAELGFAEPAPAFAPAGRVALIARERNRSKMWHRCLAPLVRAQLEVVDADTAWSADPDQHGSDVYVIDAELETPGEGLRLLAELRSRPATRHAAILIVHARSDTMGAVMALDLGANDLLTEGFPAEELAIRIRTQLGRKQADDRLRASVEEGLRLAVLDPLTGLYNRRYAEAHGRRIAASARDSRRPFAVFVADIDHFKTINDRFGHRTGDQVLKCVADRLRDRLRAGDLLARIGGEEFLVLLPDTDHATALSAAERLCLAIGGAPIPVPDQSKAIPVTISLGVSTWDPSACAKPGLGRLIDAADRALFQAKTCGRNQVTVSRTAA
ncbi:MAG: diguanylate cyclase [Pseudomonadota bacterium]